MTSFRDNRNRFCPIERWWTITAMINHVLICFSAVQICDLSYIHLHNQILRVYYKLTMRTAPGWLDSSVGRAMHQYRRGHGFESRSGLNYFVHNLDDQSCLHIFLHSSNIWSFVYSFALTNVTVGFSCVSLRGTVNHWMRDDETNATILSGEIRLKRGTRLQGRAVTLLGTGI